MSKAEQSEIWNKVYKTKSGTLPWVGIPFSAEVGEHLSSLDKKELLLVVGCGSGETVDCLYKQGFQKIVGTDISEEAIKQAKESFPDIDFRILPTEDLKNNEEFLNSNVLDWLNFHQINPTGAKNYLSSVAAIAKSVCTSWIYHDGEEKSGSYVHDGETYFHKPEMVSEFFGSQGFILKGQSKFTFSTSYKDQPIVRAAITQIYVRS
ncbi:MAG: class I SAM-dependent methyltransferase [Patescibacteria group bacterium]